MNTYLLLRNNKQTGPHTFEEMIAKNLKAYDLVWVEGKSAAWRYPGELEEFKPFAPPVEEQPYDRFFVRPNQQAKQEKSQPVNQNAGNEKIELPSLASVVKEENKEENNDKREKLTPIPSLTKFPKYVAVSLPAGKKEMGNTKVVKPVPSSKEEKIKDPVPSQANTVTPEQETKLVEEPLPKITGPVIGQDINPVWNERMTTMFPERDNKLIQQKAAGKSSISLLQISAAGAGILSLVAVGVLIGMSIVSGGSEPPGEGKDNTVQFVPVQKNNDNDPNNSNTADLQLILPDSANSRSLTPVDKKAVNTDKKITKAEQSATVAENTPVETEHETGLKKNTGIEDSESIRMSQEKEKTRQSIEQLVSLSNSTYKVGMFGGIGDVSFTVNNSSAYPLDLVVVEVSYIQSNKKVFRTEILNFKDINPSSSQTISLPKSKKGIKLSSRITYITSKNLDLSYNIPSR